MCFESLFNQIWQNHLKWARQEITSFQIQGVEMAFKTPQQSKICWWVLALVAGLLVLGCQLQANLIPGVASQRPQADAQATRPVNTGQQLPITAQAMVNDQLIELEVARTKAQQAMGLMYRTSVPDNRGMLFPFAPPSGSAFGCKMSPLTWI